MAMKFSMATAVFVAVLASVAMFQSTNAADYTVGDSSGWRVPTNNDADFYDNWADPKNFSVGDVLVFNFASGTHDVAEVNETVHDNCITTINSSNIITEGPARITVNRTGDYYFICTFTGHCLGGQKMKVEVGNGTTASTPGGSPVPTTTSPPPPPGSSSASSLVATLSLVFISIALVLVC